MKLRRYEAPEFGTIDLERYDTLHERHGHFGDWLWKQECDGIAWEGPRLMPHDRLPTLMLLYGLITLARRFAWERKLPWVEVPVGDVKAALLGSRRLAIPDGLTKSQRTTFVKDTMIHAAQEKMGWTVEDHHQADAGGVGLVAYDNLWP